MLETIEIGDIYYFGYDGLDVDLVKSSLPVRKGDKFNNYHDFFNARHKIKGSVKYAVGSESTDEALIFVNGHHIIFVGLPGKSNIPIEYLPAPEPNVVTAPSELTELYQQTMNANLRRLQTRSDENNRAYAELRNQMKKIATSAAAGLPDVLRGASAPNERAVAAYGLGLIAVSADQINALSAACRDPHEGVRNNAIRAIGSLIDERPELANSVPHLPFVELLNSPTWTDRNKAMFVLEGLTKSGDETVLRDLHRMAFQSLTEMLEWPEVYAQSAQLLLSRIAHLG